MTPIVQVSNITKRFTGVTALDDVDFDLFPGEVHALVGENGAGKSTLINILSGLIRPTSGRLFIDGNEVHFDSSEDSQRVGISTIAQEFNLVPTLTVLENMFLGRELVTRLGGISWGQMRNRAASVLAELGLNVPLNRRVEYLNVGDRQLVEVAKALSFEFRAITMDEPTATLNAAEVEKLFQIVAKLRQRGTGILYVSHRLDEVFQIADRITVLRDGRKVGTRRISDVDKRAIVTMMVGKELDVFRFQQAHSEDGTNPALSVRGLSVPGALREISFDLRYGEVLGLAGLVGSGRDELLKALFGLIPYRASRIELDGRSVRLNSPVEAIRKGIYMLPGDRKAEGIFPHLTVLENVLINSRRSVRKRGGAELFVNSPSERDAYESVQESLNIRTPSHASLIVKLSGGNQQKVIIGRALVSNSRILLLNEPTRGVDVATKQEIHTLIRKLARSGSAVLVSSSDVPELVNVSDRCLVLWRGRIASQLRKDALAEHNIVALAVGQEVVGEDP